MKSYIYYFSSLIFLLSSCFKGENVDLIIHNAQIHTLNETNDIEDAIAIKDGKIIETGPERQILNKYTATEEIDAGSRSIYPSLTDFQSNLFDGVQQQLSLDLSLTNSEEEMLFRIEKYNQKHNFNFILAYNLDTSFWKTSTKLSNDKINSLFENKPVYIVFSDKKNAILNEKALKIHKIISTNPIINFNTIKNQLPKFNKELEIKELHKTLYKYLQYGIANVHANNLSFEQIKTLESLEQKVKIYPSLKINSEKHNSYKNINSLLYIDSTNIPNKEKTNEFIEFCLDKKKQIYFDIKDSLNLKKAILLCEKMDEVRKDHRWIIHYPYEMNTNEKEAISKAGAFLTFTPSDMIKNEKYYNYSNTIQRIGLFLIGSNFPVNNLHAYEVIQNATTPNNTHALSLDETMKAYCYWSAFAMFNETKTGTLEKGKDASLVVFEKPLKQNATLNSNYAKYVFQKGDKIYAID